MLEPAVMDDATGEELGITELVHQETSYFYGSDPARVQNIETAAAQFHGLLVPPGVTFSMADALGNISLENGYAEALIIYGGQTIQGVGGGVCQVSTTLFRAAFFAGFPIPERHAHAYRVSYYELRRDGSRDPNLAGLDATVFVPIVDLKFTNDTEHWLLMETYMGQYQSLTWKFYSTKDGRTVDWQTTGATNIVPAPDPLYRENPELEKGELKKVDYAADGAKIRVTRTVYKGEQVHFSDSFYTKFQPWQEIWEYGPGTEGIPEQDAEEAPETN
jgi:vancomycin resistance protein YoaR